MKPWKVLFGTAAACAACCAAPVMSAASAAAAGLFAAGLGAYAGTWWAWAAAALRSTAWRLIALSRRSRPAK